MRFQKTTTAILGFVAGLLAAIIQLVYCFMFPFFNVIDLFFFGGLGFLYGAKTCANNWIWGLFISLPTLIRIGLTIQRLDIEEIIQGIGTGHVLSAIIVPISACLGVIFGARRS